MATPLYRDETDPLKPKTRAVIVSSLNAGAPTPPVAPTPPALPALTTAGPSYPAVAAAPLAAASPYETDPNAPPDASRQGQQQAGGLPPTGTTNQGATTPPPTTGPAEWFWGIGPGGSEAERKIWEVVQNSDPTQGLTADVLAKLQAAFPGLTVVNAGSGVVNIPGVGNVDIGRNFGAANAQWYWGASGGGGGGAPAGSAGPTGGGTEPGPGPGPSPTSSFNDAIRQQILKLMGMDLSNLDQNPAIQAQSSAYARAQQRAAEQARASIMERLNAQGLGSSGAADTRMDRMRQIQGEQSGGFNANLIAAEIDAIRNQGAQALNLGAGILSTDEENALRTWLANIQRMEYYDRLGFDRDALIAALNAGTVQFAGGG